MNLIVNKMMELKDKIEQAKRLIKSISEMHNTALAYSSGKDSVVLDYLAKEVKASVKRFHNVTTIDPPGTISFAQKHGCEIVRSKLSFLDLVEKKGFPTMFRRFCCKELKERYFADYALFGIRKSESVKRNACYSSFDDIYYYSKKKFTNRFFPLLNFTDDDVAEIINSKGLECHPQYYDHEGKFRVERRLGCIGCPLQGDRGKLDYLQYPILLKQVLRRGIIFHQKHGRTADDAALNLIYNIFYSNNKYEKYKQAFQGLFDTDPWEILENYFFLDRDNVIAGVPKR